MSKNKKRLTKTSIWQYIVGAFKIVAISYYGMIRIGALGFPAGLIIAAITGDLFTWKGALLIALSVVFVFLHLLVKKI